MVISDGAAAINAGPDSGISAPAAPSAASGVFFTGPQTPAAGIAAQGGTQPQQASAGKKAGKADKKAAKPKGGAAPAGGLDMSELLKKKNNRNL